METKLLKPVPKFVLSDVGASPKPDEPDPKPPRNPFWNVLPEKVGLKTPVVLVVGKVNVGVGTFPQTGTVRRLDSERRGEHGRNGPREIGICRGNVCNAANRLVGVVVPVVPVGRWCYRRSPSVMPE